MIASLLESQQILKLDSNQYFALTRDLVDNAWETMPDVLNGEFSTRPKNITIMLYTLGSALDRTDGNLKSKIVIALYVAFKYVFEEITINEAFYNFQPADIRLIEISYTNFQYVDIKYLQNFPVEHFQSHVTNIVTHILQQVGFEKIFAYMVAPELVLKATNEMPTLFKAEREEQPDYRAAVYYILALKLQSHDQAREDYTRYKDAVAWVKQKIDDASSALDSSPETQLLLSKADKIMSSIARDKKSTKK